MYYAPHQKRFFIILPTNSDSVNILLVRRSSACMCRTKEVVYSARSVERFRATRNFDQVAEILYDGVGSKKKNDRVIDGTRLDSVWVDRVDRIYKTS